MQSSTSAQPMTDPIIFNDRFSDLCVGLTLSDTEKKSDELLASANLAEVIRDISELSQLLQLFGVNDRHRSEILAVVDLAKVIQNASQLERLLAPRILQDSHRDTILASVNLSSVIQDGFQLRNLLLEGPYALSLTGEQKKKIWEAVRGKLSDLIQDMYQLHSLLPLPLNDIQRDEIWEAVKPKLSGFIEGDVSSLPHFLECTLSKDQKDEVLKAISWEQVCQLRSAVSLCFFWGQIREQLPEPHKSVFWGVIVKELINSTNRTDDSVSDLLIKPYYLTESEKTQIEEAFQHAELKRAAGRQSPGLFGSAASSSSEKETAPAQGHGFSG